jgi:penicillin-binding protein 1C
MLKVLLISAAITVLLFFTFDKVFPLPDNVEYSTIITDKNGDIIHAFLTTDDKWRMKTSLDEISPLLRQTIIQKEDKYFYYHVGINPFAIARAAISNILHLRRTSGASTITMQVARALEKRPRTYTNKIIEIFRAWQIEKKYNKDEIVQLYCNLLPYGGNVEGVRAAALLYFQKDPDHLSLAEITALSIVPNRPSSLVPGKNNDAIRVERNKWLRRFAKEKVFTEKQIADALAEPVSAERTTLPKLAPHLSLELKKTPQTEVHSSIDINVQSKVEKIVADYARQLRLKNIRNAAVVVIDNKTHQVISYVGSANFYDTADGGQVNGINAIRQPGSTLKPLLYAMSIDEGLLTPKSIINDVNINYGGYAPENYNKKFNGYVTMEYALEHSLNVPAVRCLDRLGTPKFIRALATCNFQQVKKDQKKLGLSMVLGGCGATLLELAGLYSTFANDGKYFRPSLTKDTTAARGTTIISAAAAFMINETLSKINRPDFPLNWQSTEHMPKIAWKTGTSYGRRDAWSIGYNKKYTVAVWAGNFSGTGVPDLSGAEVATPLLFRVFNTVDYDSDREWFSQPDDCDIRMVCAETGMPPASFCKHVITDYFVPLISPAKLCDNMQEIAVSPDEKISYCRSCVPANGYKKKWYKVIPAEIQRYYEERGIAYQKVPPHNPDCEQLFKNGHPTILSPSPGFEYLISKKDPEPLQLQCRAGNDVSRVYWYVDNRFYKMGDAHASLYFVPKEGPVKISCTDDKGRNRDIWIKVRYVDL